MHFGLGKKADQVEKTAIASDVEIHSALRLSSGERNMPDRVKLSTKLHLACDWKRVQGRSIVLDGALHVSVKGRADP